MRTRVGTFQAGLFDMDGTLIDSAVNGERAWRELAKRWQLAPPDRRLFHQVHGMPARQALGCMLPPALVDAACRELEAIEITDTQGVRALPGAVDLLGSIPEPMKAIVTSSFRAVAVARLAAAGIVPPANLVTCEAITRGKPHPEPFLEGARLLGVPAMSTVAFEDTRPGIRSALAAGCTVVAVEGLHSRGELSDADYVVASLRDVRVRATTGQGFSVELRDPAA